MNVYKFGGASVKDAEGVRNLVEIIRTENIKKLVLVVSAMDKTTRALEALVDLYMAESSDVYNQVDSIFDYHSSVCSNLFENKSHEVFSKINYLKEEILTFIKLNKSPKRAFVYDQIIYFGEMLSSIIISSYMSHVGIRNNWVDVRDVIKTDSNYRDAQVDWNSTSNNAKKFIDSNSINITQGFIGSDDNNFTTSLGLEGSDYSAAILAYCVNAQKVTVWKDVEGVLNADPRHFDKTTLLNHISFREAIELSYFGATVIHPKTIQPLQHKEIPLYVRNFNNVDLKGTVITKGAVMEPLIPCYIIKKNQIFLSISALDFSFIVEENISEIFALVAKHKLKVNLMQNSAISFTLSIEDKFNNFNTFLASLKSKYRLKYNTGVDLYTIRHFDNKSISDFEEGKEILLKQFSRETAQYIVKHH
jgi:aspartate kinase